MEEKQINFIPVNSELMFKNLFGTSKNIKFTLNMIESLYMLEEGTLKGSIIENNSILDKETILNKDFALGSEVLLNNKDKLGIEIKKEYKENSRFMQITGLYYSNLERSQEESLPKKLEIYKNSDTIDVCIFRSKENPEDTLYENTFNIILINLNKLESKHKNYKFDNWRKFISANSLEELKEISKASKILTEAYDECENFMKQGYVQNYYKEEKEKEKHLKYMREEGSIDKAEEIAIKMINNNEPLEKISKYTEISIEELKEIQEEIK